MWETWGTRERERGRWLWVPKTIMTLWNLLKVMMTFWFGQRKRFAHMVSELGEMNGIVPFSAFAYCPSSTGWDLKLNRLSFTWLGHWPSSTCWTPKFNRLNLSNPESFAFYYFLRASSSPFICKNILDPFIQNND